MPRKLTILVATMTGTAEIVAEDIQSDLQGEGWDVDLLLMDDLDETVFERGGLFLVCSSTYGQGDVPDNALAFYDRLQARRPDLSKLRYGVIALGDSTYVDTFTFGGLKFDKLLAELGARRIGEICRHDASSDEVAEDKGVAFARDWARQAAGEAG